MPRIDQPGAVLFPALGLIITLAGSHAASGQPGYLKGKVEQKNILRQRQIPTTVRSADDPFSNPNECDDFSAPETNPAATGVSGRPGDLFSGEAPAASDSPTGLATLAKDDIEEDPEVQVAWDAWHRHVAEAVFARFNQMSKAAFKYSEPLACKVRYTVTRDGQVKDIKMLEQSPNVMFNLLVTTVLKSVSGNQYLLRFPDGSRRMEVEKMGTFTQNYGREGFSYKAGDTEAVRAKGKR